MAMKLKERIRRRAHEIYKCDVERSTSRELDDWLAAENEILSEYDSIEVDHLHWLDANWPNYLDFHEAQGRHLPTNFLDSTSCEPLSSNDVRWQHMNQMAFLSYSVFINVALSKEAAEDLASISGALRVYDRTSAFFLRIGAAIDQAQHLETICTKICADGVLERGSVERPSLYSSLKLALQVVDSYNNFLKHNGLPAVKLEESDGALTVKIPDALDKNRHKTWADQSTHVTLDAVLQAALAKAMPAFDSFYKSLATQTPMRLERLGLAKKEASDLVSVRHASCGSLVGLDGYVGVGQAG